MPVRRLPHMSEPDCAVNALLDAGGLAKGRYLRYQEILKEIEDKRKHKYD